MTADELRAIAARHAKDDTAVKMSPDLDMPEVKAAFDAVVGQDLAQEVLHGLGRARGRVAHVLMEKPAPATATEHLTAALAEIDTLFSLAFAAAKAATPPEAPAPQPDAAATLARVLARMAHSPDREMRDLRREVLGLTRSDAVPGAEAPAPQGEQTEQDK